MGLGGGRIGIGAVLRGWFLAKMKPLLILITQRNETIEHSAQFGGNRFHQKCHPRYGDGDHSHTHNTIAYGVPTCNSGNTTLIINTLCK